MNKKKVVVAVMFEEDGIPDNDKHYFINIVIMLVNFSKVIFLKIELEIFLMNKHFLRDFWENSFYTLQNSNNHINFCPPSPVLINKFLWTSRLHCIISYVSLYIYNDPYQCQNCLCDSCWNLSLSIFVNPDLVANDIPTLGKRRLRIQSYSGNFDMKKKIQAIIKVIHHLIPHLIFGINPSFCLSFQSYLHY